ncbi:hypothetical protein, partial [Mycobacterium tuberculosis]|uniref:hypothetical protein n=1 Tax=Mycobacterium tuberculosis TaxID=1773 RepID=UPI001AE34ECA|nr:hypothetical protein [Mycobacterium tuberculosis]
QLIWLGEIAVCATKRNTSPESRQAAPQLEADLAVFSDEEDDGKGRHLMHHTAWSSSVDIRQT